MNGSAATAMQETRRLFFPLVPASSFGVVLGVAGLGHAWRVASRIWSLPSWAGEIILLSACVVWLTLILLFLGKCVFARAEAAAEFHDPVQCCFIGLIPASTLLVAMATLPYAAEASLVLFITGALGQIAFGVHRTGSLWMGGRSPAAGTPVLYLPVVAGGFVAATASGAFGYRDVGLLFFGAGAFTWLALESVVFHRLCTEPEMDAALRPTLGIQLAPPVVGCVAYLAITDGKPDMFAHFLFGYGVLQALILFRLIAWLREQAFAASYWAFSFGIAAFALAAALFVERGETGAVAQLAPVVFVAASVFIGGIAAGSLWLFIKWFLSPHSPRRVVKAR